MRSLQYVELHAGKHVCAHSFVRDLDNGVNWGLKGGMPGRAQEVFYQTILLDRLFRLALLLREEGVVLRHRVTAYSRWILLGSHQLSHTRRMLGPPRVH